MSEGNRIDISYYRNGKVKHIAEINENDNLDGLYVDWHPNGALWEESYYVNGRRQGKARYWSSDGTPVEERNYFNGMRHGVSLVCNNFFNQPVVKKYYHYDNNITDTIKHLVADLENITEQEKTAIMVATGISL